MYEKLLDASIASNALVLKGQELNAVPLEIFSMVHLELLDLGENEIQELPNEICQCAALRPRPTPAPRRRSSAPRSDTHR